MTETKPRIGILKTGHAPDVVLGELGDYDAMFERLLEGEGFAFDAYDVVDGDSPRVPRPPMAGSSPGRATAPTRTTPGSRRSSV